MNINGCIEVGGCWTYAYRKREKKESKSARMADKDDRYCAKNPNSLKTVH